MNFYYRKLAIELLDDEYGIPAESLDILKLVLGPSARDIVDAARIQDGRAFLPVDHGFKFDNPY